MVTLLISLTIETLASEATIKLCVLCAITSEVAHPIQYAYNTYDQTLF